MTIQQCEDHTRQVWKWRDEFCAKWYDEHEAGWPADDFKEMAEAWLKFRRNKELEMFSRN